MSVDKVGSGGNVSLPKPPEQKVVAQPAPEKKVAPKEYSAAVVEIKQAKPPEESRESSAEKVQEAKVGEGKQSASEPIAIA